MWLSLCRQTAAAQCPYGMLSSNGQRRLGLAYDSVPANRLKVGSVWVLGSSGKADGCPEDEVWDGKGIHQGAAYPPELTAQLLNHPLDGLGLLGRHVVIIAE